MKAYIHDRLAGKTVGAVLTNGKELIIQLTTGEEVVIAWKNDEPVFVRQDVRIVLPMPNDSLIGVAGAF